MSEMIERVAKSIFFFGSEHDDEMWEHMQPHLRELVVVQARAAIGAMREPTEEMVDGADDAFHEAMRKHLSYCKKYGVSGFSSSPFSEAIWRAMINSALQPATDTSEAK